MSTQNGRIPQQNKGPMAASNNPLVKLYRQPAIYFMPPSEGRWWPEDAMVVPESGEFAVYPMTSKDEVLLRTPDALINGQGMVDVIQSCVPDIKNAWLMPSTDVDAVLIAIRIASYGHAMDFESKCPHCEETHTYSMDLRSMLERIKAPDYSKEFEFEFVKIKFKPQAYFGMNKLNKINFEIQKLGQSIETINDDDVKAEETIKQMNRMIDLNLDMLAECTDSVTILEMPDDPVTNKSHILEFYRNIGGKTVTAIQEAFTELSSTGAVPPQHTNCAGCGGPLEMQVTFDYSNFFGAGS